MVLTMEETYHSQRIICLVNAGGLLLVEGVAVPGASSDDFMKSTGTDICFNSSFVAPLPLNKPYSLHNFVLWSVSSFRVLLSGQKKVSYITPWNSTHLQQLIH